ncbi:unnamed protein product [Scytosiphon promiscuus]
MANMKSGGCVPEISKRLQEGWTLLNDHCPMPNCGTPLLKDHKKRIYCAKCEMYCITADDAKSLGAANGKASTSSGAFPADRRTSGSSKAAANGMARVEDPRVSMTPLKEKPSRAAGEAALSEKLLQGWTMLAEECPTAGCCFPLMRDRNRNTTCVACGGDGVAGAIDNTTAATDHREGQFADPPTTVTSAAPISPPTPTPTPPPHGPGVTEEPEPMVSEEDFATVRKKRDALSAALGRYMLQGWSLLDKMCPRDECEPGTPLLKNRSTGTFYCAGCDTRMRDGGGAGGLVEEQSEGRGSTAGLSLKRDRSGVRSHRAPLAVEEGVVLPVPTEAQSSQAESEYEIAEKARLRKQAAREQRRDAGGGASSTLAQRLLQGWAMLSATCPERGCNNPLMRDRNGMEQCVTCGSSSSGGGGGGGGGSKSKAPDTRAVDQSGAPEPGAPEPGAPPAVPLQAAGDFAGEMEPEDVKEEALLEDEAERRYVERRMAELLARTTAGVAQTVDPGAESSAIDPRRVKEQLLDTLYKALDVSQQRLRACSCSSLSSVASADVEKGMREADLIAKLAIAARAVLNLPSKG